MSKTIIFGKKRKKNIDIFLNNSKFLDEKKNENIFKNIVYFCIWHQVLDHIFKTPIPKINSISLV